MGVTLPITSVEGHINAIRDVAPRYWKGVSDLTIRNFLTFYNLQKYGALTFRAKNHSQVWTARIKQPTIIPAIDGQPIEFVNWDTDVQFSLGVKGYRGTDMMGEQEVLQNQGSPEAITDRYTRKSSELAQSMMERLSGAYYKSGTDAANIYDFAGLKTCLSHAAGTVTNSDKIALANGTYAGQSCVLGNLGGTWTSQVSGAPNANLAKAWPFGQGSSEYDATTPLIVNYASSAWDTGSGDWGVNAIAATSWAQTAMLHRGGQSMVGAMPNCVMASEMFTEFKNSFRENNRQIMPWRDGDLGYRGETLQCDGIVYSMDYAVPQGEAYMYLPQYVEAFFLHDNIYGQKGPEYSIAHTAHLYYISCYGNFKFLPKYLARFIAV